MVILRSFGAFSIFDNLVSQKWLVVERNEWHLGLGGEYSVYTGYFWHLSSECHSEVIWCISDFQNNLFVSRKWQDLERNIHLNLYVIQFYVVIFCHLVKQSAKTTGLLVVFYGDTWDSIRAKYSKRYSSYKSQPNVFKLLPKFLLNAPHKTTFGIFEKLHFNSIFFRFR